MNNLTLKKRKYPCVFQGVRPPGPTGAMTREFRKYTYGNSVVRSFRMNHLINKKRKCTYVFQGCWNFMAGGPAMSSTEPGSPAAGPCQTLLPNVVM
jgi:hypothetical protein